MSAACAACPLHIYMNYAEHCRCIDAQLYYIILYVAHAWWTWSYKQYSIIIDHYNFNQWYNVRTQGVKPLASAVEV